jgi:uncharacterized membrane protein
MKLRCLRATLAIYGLFIVAGLGVLVLFFGKDLSQTQVVLLTMIATALVAELKSASSYIFDGTPGTDVPPPPKGNSP